MSDGSSIVIIGGKFYGILCGHSHTHRHARNRAKALALRAA